MSRFVKSAALWNTLKDEGVRLNDIFEYRPLFGHKRTIKLTRTKYYFSQKKHKEFKDPVYENSYFPLTSLDKENAEFLLELCPNEVSKCHQQENWRFTLKSLTEVPFKINGVSCFEAYVFRGDKVILSHNEIIFTPQETYENKIFQERDLNIELNKKLVQSDWNVLITGQTGVGKTRLAKIIHQKSERRGPFVHLNITSFSSNLLESELFGHVKGSFTGALNDKMGAFQQANEGTLFIDEIDSLPLSIQTKLLIFLDSKEFRPIGSNETLKSTARIIFAGGQLEPLVKKEKMRLDFFYRLNNSYKIDLPPLKEDKQYIQQLILNFASKRGVVFEKKLITFYQEFSWPGNIRQLLTHLHLKYLKKKTDKIYYDCDDEQLLELKNKISIDKETINGMMSYRDLKTLKENYAKFIFYKFDCNVKLAASILKINKQTLNNMIGR